jgi:putative transposase
MIRYIDEHRRSYGVEPICRTLAVAPSSYYAAKARPPSARSVNDAALADVIGRIHRANFGVYGSRKVWKALRRLGVDAGRDQVARVMRLVGLQGATRTKRVRTTRPAPVGQRPADLVERVFSAPAPNRLWVADLTYVWTARGFAYAAFMVDAFSRAIVGWRVAASLHTELALDALDHRPVQARTHPPAGAVAEGRPGRAGHRSLGPLVEHRPAPRGLRPPPAGRVRGGLPTVARDHRGRVDPMS